MSKVMLEEGDTVLVKGIQSPLMLVTRVWPDSGIARCCWFDSLNCYHSREWDSSILIPVDHQ